MEIIMILALCIWPKKNKITTILMLSLSISLLITGLHFSLLPKLFGHCSSCNTFIEKEIDFSRDENILGTPFSANEVSSVSSIILAVATIIAIAKEMKKTDIKKASKIVIWILTIGIIGFEIISHQLIRWL